MDFGSFMMEMIDGEFHFILEGGVGDEGSSPSTRSVNNEALTIDADPLIAVHPSKFTKTIGDSDDAPSEQDKVTLIDHTTIEKTQNQRVSASSKAAGKRKHTAKSFEREPRQKFPSAKELKESADSHFVVAHARASCDAIQEREVEKDKAYAKLERKCNEALLHGEYSRLVLKEKKWVNWAAYVSWLHVTSSMFHGTCTSFEEVVALKEPFDLEKMHGYPEATADPYASIKKLLSKKPKSLRTKPALSKSKPSSLGAPVN
ncbi:hypothetical protein Tco_0158782 [Tanacetum coccineum]